MMNEQYLEKRVDPLENVEGIDKRTNSPVVNSDPFADKAPVDEALVQETQMNETIVDEAPPVVEMATHEAAVVTSAASSAALLTHEESENFRTQWNTIQGKFVDEPRAAVQQADALVSEVVEHITQMFAKNHSTLESQWKQGDDVSTEDLRKALQQYRSFFNRLVV